MRPPFRLKFRLQSHFQYLPFLTRLFHGLREAEAGRLTQILVEAYNNAVQHAHRQKKEKWVTIDIQKTNRKMILRIWDEGPGILKKNFQRKSASWVTHGRGLALIQGKADQIRPKKTKKGHCLEAVCSL